MALTLNGQTLSTTRKRKRGSWGLGQHLQETLSEKAFHKIPVRPQHAGVVNTDAIHSKLCELPVIPNGQSEFTARFEFVIKYFVIMG